MSLPFVTIWVFEFYHHLIFRFFVIVAIWAFEFCCYFSFVAILVLSQFKFWVFFYNLSFWAQSKFELSIFEFLSFVTTWVLDFFYLGLVKILFVRCIIFSFWVWSQFELLSSQNLNLWVLSQFEFSSYHIHIFFVFSLFEFFLFSHNLICRVLSKV